MATNKAGVKELAQSLMQEYSLSKADAEKFVQTMFEIVNNGLHNDKLVKVKGLGTFKVTSIASRRSIDVNTGEPIVIEGRDKISYLPDAQMRDLVNRPFSQFETVLVNDGVDFSEIDRKFAENPEAELNDVDEFLEQYEPEQETSSTTVPNTSTDNEPEKEKAETENNRDKQDESDTHTEAATPLRLTSAQLSVLNGDISGLASSEETLADETPSSESTEESYRPHTFTLTPYQLGVLNNSIVKQPSPAPTQDSTTSQEPSMSHNELPNNEQIQGNANASQTEEDKITTVVGEPPATETYVQSDASEVTSTKTDEQLAAMSASPASVEQHNTDFDSQPEESKTPLPTPATELLKNEINRSHRIIKWMVAVVALLVVTSAVALFYLFGQLNKRDNRIRHLETSVALKNNTEATANTVNKAALSHSRADSARIANELAQLDTIKSARNGQQSKSSDRPSNVKVGSQPTAAQTQPTTKQQTTKKQNVVKKQTRKTEVQASVYDKDPRVRTGAYRIVGIDHLLTVRKGQTLHSISRSTLGPGMECYIEAVNNGRTEFKEGEKIKIPKLQLKRKK